MSGAVGVLAAAVTAAGVMLLRLSWGRRRALGAGERAPWIAGGWSALACATLLWSAAAGMGRGVALALLATALAAIIVIGLDALAGSGARGRRHGLAASAARPPRRPAHGVEAARARRLVRGAATFALAGPIAGAAAIVLAVPLYAMLDTMGLAGADLLAVLVLLVPVAWAALAVVATVDIGLRRRAAWVTGGAALAALGAVVAGLAA